jgi:DNA-binding transcriptional regulator YhcF (GntR family)
MSLISIQNKIGIPKYKQIVNSIEDAIISGLLKKGDQLPSVNSIKNEHSLSRDTVLNAFNELKVRGIVQSVVGKGYYVLSEDVEVTQKVFLLFDELNSFKEDLYSSFLDNLGENIQVDIFFHHFNYDIFNKIIYDNVGDYNHYVIMPANLKNTGQVIGILPKDKVYILDQTHKDLSSYSGVFQNFEKDIYNNLLKAKSLIDKYKKMILVFTKDKQPQGMLKGFVAFAKDYNLGYEIIEDLQDRHLEKGDVYVIPDDKNLLRIIKKIKEEGLILSKDIGIISYNDTLLKEIVEGGITTISTDFNEMGKRLAEMVLNKQPSKIENVNDLIIRNSL